MQPPEPCKPFTPCWCELHPTNPNCTPSVSIDHQEYIILAVFLIIVYLVMKNVFKK